MASLINLLTATLALSSTITAHLGLLEPAQFRTSWNPKAGGITNSEYRDPLKPDGSDYPCMNDHKGMTEASSVATWEAGSNKEMSIEGTANHNGGSCQVSLSYDKGKTFTVIHSYIGGCPALGQPLAFKVPSDAPSGLTIFSWSWINHTGNREFYQKCAAVTIKGGKGKSTISFSNRPKMLIANLAGLTTCKATEGIDPVFPNPGLDVTGKTGGPSGLTGSCGDVVASPGSGTDKSTTQNGGKPGADLAPAMPNTLPVSSDGSCGAAVGRSCAPGMCCSQWGFCGSFDGHCKDGCQPAYGQCRGGGGAGKSGKSDARRKYSPMVGTYDCECATDDKWVIARVGSC